MKKIFLFCILFLNILYVNASVNLANNSETAILIEASTKKILYEKDINKKMAPASMTKMMTLLLAMEKLNNGTLSLDDEVLISKAAQSMGGTQIYVEENSYVKVSDLIKGIGIASANDAAYALAEKIGGSVDNFVSMMNEKARELGCKNTTFKNPHGLDEEGHLTTAYDMALIASELVKYPLALKISSTYDEYINVSGENHWLVNTNKLIKFYKGIDGLKTGYTTKAGYCLTATMNKNNMRLISVVMNSKSKDDRTSDTIGLMEYGYSMYGSELIYSKDDFTGEIYIKGSTKSKYKYNLDDNIKLIVSKDVKNVKYDTSIELFELKAPLVKGSKVGNLYLNYDGKTYLYNLIINEDVKKSSYLKTVLNNLKDTITGKIRKK